MKIGDYVRSDRGIIAKITNINKTGSIICDRNIYYGFNVVTNKRVLCDLSKIVKFSSNIMDLIEIGDYVNGYYVINKPFNERIDTELDNFTKEEIKSIVTKEQFAKMEYKLGE